MIANIIVPKRDNTSAFTLDAEALRVQALMKNKQRAAHSQFLETDMRALFPLIAAVALPSAAQAQNLIPNGDFEAGNTGFTSGYSYSPGGNSTEGQYTVRTDPFPWNGFFLSRGDHTSGTGLMFVGNGAPVAGQIVWQSGPIAISSMTNYFFEAFTMNVCCGTNYGGGNSDPNFTFRISLDGGDPTDLATLTIPANQAGQWFGLSTNFNSGSATSILLTLVNANTTAAGNDFAIDDISLSTRSIVNAVPEPSTWALLILGFGAVGSAMRRKAQLRYAAARPARRFS